MIQNHRCLCTEPGYCKLFRKDMTADDYDDCQNTHTSFQKMDQIETLYVLTDAIRCKYKGNAILDEAGFHKKRASGSCCGGVPRKTVHVYDCLKFGSAGFAEDMCESRCTEFVSHHLIEDSRESKP
jgi:hypothetical protein